MEIISGNMEKSKQKKIDLIKINHLADQNRKSVDIYNIAKPKYNIKLYYQSHISERMTCINA